jgi:hypothetical protein
MLTNNFNAMIAIVLQRCSTYKGLLPITAYNGTQYWINPGTNLSSVTMTLTTSASGTGICVGTGNTAAAATDYQLESPITSGLTASVTQMVGVDGSGNPYLTFDVTITNTGSASVTIKEIGYRQNLSGATENGGSSVSNRVCLLDRTVLDEPVTIAAGGIGTIRYTLKTVIV